jgi:hypothetical protein
VATYEPAELARQLGYVDEDRPGKVVRDYLRFKHPEHPRHQRWVLDEAEASDVLTNVPRNMGADRRTIRVFVEWGCEWPLWENGERTPADYNLTSELTTRIRDWVDVWEVNLDMNTDPPEWRGDMTERSWTEEGRRVSEAIGWEVAAFADVVFTMGGSPSHECRF